MKVIWIALFVKLIVLTYSLPDHEFIADVKQKTKSNGTVDTKTSITLVEGPYKFTRKKRREGKAYFSCHNAGKGCKATAKSLVTGDHNEVDSYVLDNISTDHSCADSLTDRKKEECFRKMKNAIKENPMATTLPELHSTVRNEMAKDMNAEERRQFFQSVGKFTDIASSLYSVQHSLVPLEPQDQL